MNLLRTQQFRNTIMRARVLALAVPLLACLPLSTQANVNGVPAPQAPCAKGSLLAKNLSGYCWFNGEGANNGTILYGAGTKYPASMGGLTLTNEFKNSYVPYSGNYNLLVHICSSSEAGQCLLNKSVATIKSKTSATLRSSSSISSQNPNFGGTLSESGFPYSFNVCYTLGDDKGHEWGDASEPMTCQDATQLPKQGATCSLNYNNSLNVDMGEVMRSKLDTVANSSLGTNVTKEYSVICTRDSMMTMKTTFQFTPININGSDVVKTSTIGIGVAIFEGGHPGEPVSPSDAPIADMYDPGVNTRKLVFQVMRDPNVAVKDIPLGYFNASAVMIMNDF